MPAVLRAIVTVLQDGAGPLGQAARLPIDPVNHEADELIERFSESVPILKALIVCAGVLAPLST